MHPDANKFMLDVRRATSLELKPTVTTDTQLIDPKGVADALQRATIWLTPKVVEGYSPMAFESWPPDHQERLRDAVNDFRSVAAAIPSDSHPTAAQMKMGVRSFSRLKDVVRDVTLWEWCKEANGLIDRVELWANKFEWPVRRERKHLNELLLGEYELDRLYMHAEGNLYILDPVARFIPKGLGTFDLSIQPSFFTTSVYRDVKGTWRIHLDEGSGAHRARKSPLSSDSLKRAVSELRSLLNDQTPTAHRAH